MENLIKRAVIMAENGNITAADLGLEPAETESIPFNLRHVREEAERRAIIRALSQVGGSIAQAAELLGISRPTLYDLMNKTGLK